MEFEFQESDVVFSNNEEQDRIIIRRQLDEKYLFDFEDVLAPVHGNPKVMHSECQKKKKKSVASSPPVNIPNNHLPSADYSDGSFEDDGDNDGGKVIPPHLIVGRRVAGKLSSSMSTNGGRMMKGRYMSEFRDSVLRMTGFLES